MYLLKMMKSYPMMIHWLIRLIIFFSNTVDNLGITGYPTEDENNWPGEEQISIVINNFKDHSVLST